MNNKPEQLSRCRKKAHFLGRTGNNWLAFLALIFATIVFALPCYATNPPILTPPTGVYSRVQPSLTITGDPGANFFFTTDGSTPTIGSTPYTTAIPLGGTNIVKSIASLGGVQSLVTTAYVLNDASSLPVPRTGLKLWLRSDLGPVLSGSNLTQWSDLSGSNNNATQATSANQPTFVAGSINGEPSVQFNGTNSFMTLANGLSDLTTGATIVGYLSPNIPTGAKTIFTSGGTGVNDMVSLQTNGTTAVANFNNGSTVSNVATASGALTTTKFQSIDVVHNGAASANLEVNAVPAITGTVQNLNNVARTINRLGVDSALTGFWGGKLTEILVWARPLTISETAAVTGYLANRYQTGVNATTPTPIISLPTGTYADPVQVAISAEPPAIAHVTIDGTTPTALSPVVSAPFMVAYTTVVKAIAISPSGLASSVATSTLTLNATKFPAPAAGDLTPLQINLQLPTAIPQ